ncbi:MAG TPA: hypothetical protein VEL07_15995 [Planctomycetota bacterium]|nr:hypothetical protein [Planctomycetota bacterium]
MPAVRPRFLLPLLTLAAAAVGADEVRLLQGFEAGYQPSTYGDAPGAVELSAEWASDGSSSLRIDPQLITSVEDLATYDWTGSTALRVHARNPGATAINVSFELFDHQASGYWDRHIDSFGVAPGDQVIDIDISGPGALWRSEANGPYRGSIKTPIEIGRIKRMAFQNRGDAPLFIDRLELVRVEPLTTAGGFAFDFGSGGAMPQFIAVDKDTAYAADRGYGMLGGDGWTVPTSPSYPTMMLGDGLTLGTRGFRVDLQPRAYVGWIAFERGGFWQGEQCGYTKALLKAGGTVVHEHGFHPDGAHHLFEDLEITDLAEVAERLVWPTHAVARFEFTAGTENVFTLDTEGAAGTRLRVAGLILAPATAEGRAFIDAHEELQRRAVVRTFAPQERGRRGAGRAAPAADLVVEPLAPGEQVMPRDWPSAAPAPTPPTRMAVMGQTVTVHLGVHARRAGTAEVRAQPLKGPGTAAIAPSISHGRYLPTRPYENGVTWLEVNHYRPEPSFSVGPELARSVVVEYAIPRDAAAGAYTSSITVSGVGGKPVTLPVRIEVASVPLADLPIPVGVFMNSLPFAAAPGQETQWWAMQESALAEQLGAGLTALTGGPGLRYDVDPSGAVSGADAVRYVTRAKELGTVHGVFPYGGFLPGLGDLPAPPVLAAGLAEFEKRHGLPPTYVNCYDEPNEHSMAAHIERVAAATKAGLRTWGFTSVHRNDATWEKLLDATYAPAVNTHGADDLRRYAGEDRRVFVYNNGLDRYGEGLHLWRGIQLGADGRFDWIGFYTQGFAFNNLDAREPSFPCFHAHRRFGVLKTPIWLGAREGLLDVRIRLTLEKVAPKDDPALALWTVDGYREDGDAWPASRLDGVRAEMLKRILALVR